MAKLHKGDGLRGARKTRYLLATALVLLLLIILILVPKSQPSAQGLGFEQMVLAQNTACFNNNVTSDLATAACPAGADFRPLGSYYPVGAFVAKCGCRHPSHITLVPFLVEFYKHTRAKFPKIPFNLVVDRSCISSCYSHFVDAVGPDAKFNTIFITSDNRTDYFAQDAYVSGVWGSKNENAVFAQEQNIGEGCGDLKFLSEEQEIGEAINQQNDSTTRQGYFSSLDDRGGNILPLPGALVAVGDTLSSDLEAYLTKQGSKVIRLDVRNLPARHVDEMFSLVRTAAGTEAAPCDFVIAAASPKLAQELVRAHKIDSLTMDPAIATKHESMVTKNLLILQRNFREHLGCKRDVPVVRFPMAWTTYQEGSRTYYKSVWPNPVNAQVINSSMVIAKPPVEVFRTEIERALAPYKIEATFIDASEIRKLYGGIHCATKTLHSCRSE